MAQCEPYFEAVIASRREDGYFGPESLRNIETNGMPVPDLSRETGRGGTDAHLRAPGLHARPHELFSVVPKTVTISYLYTEAER